MTAQVLEAMVQKIEALYVFPEKAKEIGAAIRERMAKGAYESATESKVLAELVTEHLQELSRDGHLRLQARHLMAPQQYKSPEEFAQAMALQNYGFHKVERLPGNVGYLDLRMFMHPELAGDVAVAAMNFLASSSALIVDLRSCPGGSPLMVALLTSYLFEGPPVHLNSFYNRGSDQLQQFWTHNWVPGKRLGKRLGKQPPVYVLASRRTFSAAEEFTYNLKHLKRATIIGETTGGGAHPGQAHPLSDELAIFVPSGRAINPITGTNWEGVGVEPDIAVPQAEALQVAHREALKQVLAQIGDRPEPGYQHLLTEAEKALAELEG